jgi:OOP family OmpA-OmpF porin
MKTLGKCRILLATAPILLVLATSGCATKKYVSKHIDPVNQRVNTLQAKTTEQFGKQQREISQLGERLTSTDNHLSAVASTAQQANATAGQALQATQTNASAIQANEDAINTHSAELVKLKDDLNHTLAESANVTFSFNKWELSSDAKAALDLIIRKATATPRSVIEVVGYTDEIGPRSYNLTLSRRRAEAVARYLVQNNVPLKSISLIGLGEEQTPKLLAAEVENFNPAASKKEIRGLARRVRIRLYVPGTSSNVASTGATTDADLQK